MWFTSKIKANIAPLNPPSLPVSNVDLVVGGATRLLLHTTFSPLLGSFSHLSWHPYVLTACCHPFWCVAGRFVGSSSRSCAAGCSSVDSLFGYCATGCLQNAGFGWLCGRCILTNIIKYKSIDDRSFDQTLKKFNYIRNRNEYNYLITF
jgi:hypothetical protein